MQLTQIRLIVNDLDRAFRYYRDIVGLKPQYDPPTPPYAAFKPDLGSTLALHDRAQLATMLGGALDVGGPRGADRALVALRVDNLDGYLAQVTERGGEVTAGPVDFGRLRTAYLRDPEGNLIELQEWLE